MKIEKDALCNTLAELRVSGAIALGQSYDPPWAIEVPAGTQLAQMMGLDHRVTVVPFHLVRRGHFELYADDNGQRVIREGEVVLCTNGQGHTMRQGEGGKVLPFEQLIQQSEHARFVGGKPGSTELICGVFTLHNTKTNPLIKSLPATVQVDVSGRTSSHTLYQLSELLTNELSVNDRNGRSYMIERILELFYAEVIRIYAESNHQEAGGWLLALNDRRLADALNYIHAHPDGELSVPILAAQVAMSPSRFAARFRQLLGQSVMAYVSSWRLTIAAQKMIESNLSIKEIAYSHGYRSLPAFNRAFAKHHGMPPARWRNASALSSLGS